MIEFLNVTKSFGGPAVLHDISLTVPRGELVILIGPSGCGKSTLLRLVNRLLEPTSGDVRVGGVSVLEQDPVALRRRLGYVIQSVGLFPHLTVQENVELVPSISGVAREARAARARELLSLMGLEPGQYAGRYPRQLSGGQQQRVGIARALAADPEYLLMDEPFSALDPVTRAHLQEQFLTLKREIGKTILFVTHDVDEAVRLGDRICVLGGGAVQQYAAPEEVLRRPANDFVASFVGEGRELRRLGLRPVRAVMRPGAGSAEALGTVGADLPADQALSRLLGAGDGVLNVVDAGGAVVGTLRLADFGAA
ncbi:ABC transporter ATP-binding protein (plasmid) [Deinococcus wulumuqiensis]|uniref:ABC transporter ATP-binding protein n=1 Tax=Deinococcus wulumuqiensis TaxID=980427 RepID=A0A345IKK2_9DEIO|nr:ABC transporter ATP-binding protein [Deinococcus wulumuqiensis]AXH00225.1 ABC transporter ATP-binding protein [Deinococcus wulumuqiensis]